MSLACPPAHLRPDPATRAAGKGRAVRGATLVELLVGLVITLVIMGGAFAGYLAVANASRTNILADRINVDVQTILNLMANDIRRAGYRGTPGTGNPFSVIHPTSGTSNCFLYSYDADGDGTKDADEFYGFRLTNGTIQIRTNGSSDTDCSNGTWQPLSDPQVMNVTALTFTPSSGSVTAGGVTVWRRWITIDLTVTGPNPADGVTKSARTVVEIRNDHRTP